jgi:hypothetical protein
MYNPTTHKNQRKYGKWFTCHEFYKIAKDVMDIVKLRKFFNKSWKLTTRGEKGNIIMNLIQPTFILYSTHKYDLKYPCRLEDTKYE